jgi:heme-degrading monooxygenase HmoA
MDIARARRHLRPDPSNHTDTKGSGSPMFIAMNRFQVRRGYEAEFEQVWKNRDSHLNEVPGFITFHLLKGPEFDEYTLYSSYTQWRSREDFETWTRSEAFRKAHANAGETAHIYLDRPRFESFEVVQSMG